MDKNYVLRVKTGIKDYFADSDTGFPEELLPVELMVYEDDNRERPCASAVIIPRDLQGNKKMFLHCLYPLSGEKEAKKELMRWINAYQKKMQICSIIANCNKTDMDLLYEEGFSDMPGGIQAERTPKEHEQEKDNR